MSIPESALTGVFEMLVERMSGLESAAEQLSSAVAGLAAGQARLLKTEQLKTQRDTRVVAESGLNLTFARALAGEHTVPFVHVRYYAADLGDGEISAFGPWNTASVDIRLPGDFSERREEYIALLGSRARHIVQDRAWGVARVQMDRAEDDLGRLHIFLTGKRRALWWDEWLAAVLDMVSGIVEDTGTPWIELDPGLYPDSPFIDVHRQR